MDYRCVYAVLKKKQQALAAPPRAKAMGYNN